MAEEVEMTVIRREAQKEANSSKVFSSNLISGKGEEWNPVTKLGRLVKSGHVDCLETIFRYSIPIKGNHCMLIYRDPNY